MSNHQEFILVSLYYLLSKKERQLSGALSLYFNPNEVCCWQFNNMEYHIRIFQLVFLVTSHQLKLP